MPALLAAATRRCSRGAGLSRCVRTGAQSHKPRSHTIVEAHPDVYAHMLRLGWGDKPGVTILHGRWQDVLPRLGQYDGIFFDTYGEYYQEMAGFHEALPRLLRRPAGVYSFFNGLAPDNIFFHTVYGRCGFYRLSVCLSVCSP